MGQEEDFEEAEEKAKSLGAKKVYKLNFLKAFHIQFKILIRDKSY